jgi:hypothetical protein
MLGTLPQAPAANHVPKGAARSSMNCQHHLHNQEAAMCWESGEHGRVGAARKLWRQGSKFVEQSGRCRGIQLLACYTLTATIKPLG